MTKLKVLTLQKTLTHPRCESSVFNEVSQRVFARQSVYVHATLKSSSFASESTKKKILSCEFVRGVKELTKIASEVMLKCRRKGKATANGEGRDKRGDIRHRILHCSLV